MTASAKRHLTRARRLPRLRLLYVVTTSQSRMQCTACNVSLPENARFCLQCGTPASPSAIEPPDPLREKLKVALGQQYELIRLLGKGGMGAVYLARETALEREVAIKVLTPDLSMNRE